MPTTSAFPIRNPRLDGLIPSMSVHPAGNPFSLSVSSGDASGPGLLWQQVWVQLDGSTLRIERMQSDGGAALRLALGARWRIAEVALPPGSAGEGQAPCDRGFEVESGTKHLL